MLPLETVFEDRSYRYIQIERQGDLAIFEQRHKANPIVIRYEVVRIRIKRATTLPSGATLPEREAYPSSSAWGQDGFTVWAIDQARALMVQLQAKAVA
jgi:hypothetical protein